MIINGQLQLVPEPNYVSFIEYLKVQRVILDNLSVVEPLLRDTAIKETPHLGNTNFCPWKTLKQSLYILPLLRNACVCKGETF